MITIDGQAIKPTIFPDGTSQIWKLDLSCYRQGTYLIEWRFESESEFIHLAQLKDLLDHEVLSCQLLLPYLPYGRQDKPISNQQTFALRTFCKLLNTLGFYRVSCFDPHSEVAGELIDNFYATYPVYQVESLLEGGTADLLCYPDRGALNKYHKLFKGGFIHGAKVRDQSTGFITDYELIGDPSGKSVLIVDDICDGGATFVILAKSLIQSGAREVHLFVSHGLFSKGTQVLRDAGIKRIFTKEGEVK